MDSDQQTGIPRVAPQLTTEDYENIWLRLKDRYWRWVAVWVAAIGLTTFWAGFEWAKKQVDAKIADYVRTDEFKENVSKAVVVNLSGVEERIRNARAEVNDLDRLAEILKRAPIAVDNSGLAIVGSRGDSFQVQYGEASLGAAVKFARKFQRPPLVLVAWPRNPLSRQFRIENAESGYQLNFDSIAVPLATEEGFSMPGRLGVHSKYRWTAIGS